jgi:glycosyltransferase involved in cell wall biosynthesis
VAARPRISFFVHDLADNPVGRAAPLAMALRRHFDIELLGLLCSGTSIYQPYRNLFEFKVLSCSLDLPSVVATLPQLAALASGDVIYACKPLVTSLGPALLAARNRRRPLLLDVEDDEWIPLGKSRSSFIWRDLIRGWRHATAWKYTRAMHYLTRFACAITVATTTLQVRYGGVIVRHGPDENVFDPERPDLRNKLACRRLLNLPLDRPLALFAGLPRPHKGWPTLLEAFLRPCSASWHLVLVGPQQNPEFVTAAEKLGSRCHRLGFVEYSDLPSVLAAVDAVPVPQRQVHFAQSQNPAKLMDAMAMGKSVLASRVGDIPAILGDGSRGWLFEPDDVSGLANALQEVESRPTEAVRRGEAAREWFVRNASANAIRERLLPLLLQYAGIEVDNAA